MCVCVRQIRVYEIMGGREIRVCKIIVMGDGANRSLCWGGTNQGCDILWLGEMWK